MTAHQRKKLEYDALVEFRDRFELPLSEADLRDLRFVRLPDDSPEMRYLRGHREALGGYLPARDPSAPVVTVPELETMEGLLSGSGEREYSTTMAFVQLLRTLLRDPNVGPKIVPIVADEARTFGMEALFRQVGIYSPFGQLYDPEDKDQLSYYKEAREGQILEEGITEAGALSSWLAAATSYAVHREPMLPFYIFYSMFGFQRVGDMIWAAADSRARGFLMGATSGRTTLSGEGLQHQDGSSHLAASTIPTCRAYDPAFAHELAVIVRDGMRRMLEAQEDVFYYVTVMNENYAHPPLPPRSEEGILRGMYLLRAADKAAVQLLGSGTILREAMSAADILEREHGVRANVWSVTSWTELRWDGLRSADGRTPWVTASLAASKGPIVAASDYVTALPDLVRAWIPPGRPYVTLGTDGFGMSDTRAALREHFGVSAQAIARTALRQLGKL
jgi:pyruvate dehydrogenase E1 component